MILHDLCITVLSISWALRCRSGFAKLSQQPADKVDADTRWSSQPLAFHLQSFLCPEEPDRLSRRTVYAIQMRQMAYVNSTADVVPHCRCYHADSAYTREYLMNLA